MNKIEELRKQLELEDRILTVVDNHDSLVEWVKGEKPEHCILPEHYKGIVRDFLPIITSAVEEERERCVKKIETEINNVTLLNKIFDTEDWYWYNKFKESDKEKFSNMVTTSLMVAVKAIRSE